MGRRKSNPAYNIRSGINVIQTDKKRDTVETHGHDFVINDDAIQDGVVTPAIIPPSASGAI